MSQVDLIDGLSDAERQLAIEGLRALRRERGRAWNIACDIAERAGKKQPPLGPYAINNIEKLARHFGGTAPHLHWFEE